MNKPVTLIACFVLFLVRNTVFAQDILKIDDAKASKRDTKTYYIQSLDGKPQKLHIMPDYFNHILRMSCLKDTISIFDYWGVPPDVEVLNKNFIEIEYAVRGGSNEGFRNLMILCLNANKLIEAMHVSSYANFEFGDREGTYNIKPVLNGDNKNNYKLHVSIQDEVKSTSKLEESYNYKNQSILNFDVNRNVFYSIKDDLYGNYKFYHSGGLKGIQQKIGGDFPVIILGKVTYYFIKDGWYSLGKDHDLSGYTFRNVHSVKK